MLAELLLGSGAEQKGTHFRTSTRYSTCQWERTGRTWCGYRNEQKVHQQPIDGPSGRPQLYNTVEGIIKVTLQQISDNSNQRQV
jgi:hypothetical protein